MPTSPTHSQPVIIEGELSANDFKIAIVAARFNDFIVAPLLRGALDALARNGASMSAITVARVPGAFELPLVVRRLAFSKRFDAVIALGAVIRGDTPHFDYVAGECAAGLARAALDSNIPIVFGVLTTDSVQQATDRAGGKEGNKGADAALTALEMISLLRKLDA